MKDFFGAMTHLSVPDSMFGPVWQVEDLLDAMQGYDVTGLAAKMKKRLKFGEAFHYTQVCRAQASKQSLPRGHVSGQP